MGRKAKRWKPGQGNVGDLIDGPGSRSALALRQQLYRAICQRNQAPVSDWVV